MPCKAIVSAASRPAWTTTSPSRSIRTGCSVSSRHSSSGVSSLKQYQDSGERKVREGRKAEFHWFSLRSLRPLRSSSLEPLLNQRRWVTSGASELKEYDPQRAFDRSEESLR